MLLKVYSGGLIRIRIVANQSKMVTSAKLQEKINYEIELDTYFYSKKF